FEGKATWFIPHKHHGEIGACGEYEADDDWIVAMNADQYGDMDEVSDDVCFRKVRIYHDGKSVDATVTDACPSCDYGDLDLTQVVFQELGKLKTGVLDITWEF
ncbi:RlpA-like double-psi beta-barrel-protein domain-containing protein-containing protein, partial [Mycotypha africana]|uniref:RlpA-like double-psi beta-barrel-protein domain-containing protein-containing protein n=1 Tax=Mycotypha africana TaxID=64632 RepID=UPI0022FFF8E1